MGVGATSSVPDVTVLTNMGHSKEMDDSVSKHPAGWSIGIDQYTGNSYYFNVETGESSWELPNLNSRDPRMSKPVVGKPPAYMPRER